MSWAIHGAPERSIEVLRPRLRQPRVARRLLSSVLSEGFSNRLGEMAVRRTTALPWDFLATALGDDIDNFVLTLADTTSSDGEELDPRTMEALELAVRYAQGWRPTDELAELIPAPTTAAPTPP